MTDTNKLKELAERAIGSSFKADVTSSPIGQFCAAANPQAILGLIERLEKAEQHWANENSNNMALIAEVERLREKLGECSVSLQGEMMQKYGGQQPEDMHPVTRRDYDRDMAEILEYQEALVGDGR